MGVTEAVAAVVIMKAAALVVAAVAAVQARANCDVALHSAEQLVE